MKNFALLFICISFIANAQSSKPNSLFNDDCSNVLNVYNQDLPYNFTETNGYQATNNDGFIGACSNIMNDGEWFRVYGTGGLVTISITNVTPTYDPQIAVFSGSCSNLVCVATEDVGTNGGNETISFLTVKFEPYYVNIGHYSDILDLPEGNFTINVAQAFGNDDCTSAYDIPESSLLSLIYNYNETLGNQATNNAGFITACGQGTNDGEWFKFTGTGKSILIDLQEVGANYDPRISVYSGNCNNLTCVATVDEGISGQNEKLLVPTTIGIVYYINIGYYSPNNDFSEGNFRMYIRLRLPNDECTTPKLITSLPFDYTENDYYLVTASTTGNCAGSNRVDHWFQFTGDGTNKKISLTDLSPNYNAQFVVYTGFCDNLTCNYIGDFGGEGTPEYADIPTISGRNYLISVCQANSIIPIVNYGVFRLQVENTALANQDFEKNAIKISLTPNPSNGQFKIETQEKIETLNAFDLLGKEIKLTSLNNNFYQIDNQVSGIYFIKVALANGFQATQKLVIQ